MNLLRLFQTVRHLKPIQIYGRLWFILYRPKADLRKAPPLRKPSGHWVSPVYKRRAMVDFYTFEFMNKTHTLTSPLDWNNPKWTHLWLYNLHYFDDLQAFDSATRTDWHRALIDKWIAENPPAGGVGWESYPTSIRIVNWIKWQLSGGELSPKAIHSLAVQARFLEKRLETYLQGNHLLANGKALIFAGALFESAEADRWLRVGLNLVREQVKEQILRDGGHFELSPMYHSIVLEDLLDLYNLLQAFPQAFPDRERLLEDWGMTIGQMRHWLKVMSHPDGNIALFNDAAFDIAAHPATIEAYARRLGLRAVPEPQDGITHLKDSGFVRVQRNELVAILDVGRIGPDYLPGHAHADIMSFELSLFGNRLIVDSGTSTYEDTTVRFRQRSTGAHNTVVVNGQNSSDVWGSFRVAKRAYPIGLTIDQEDDHIVITCGHTGYQRLRNKVTHWRTWLFGDHSLVVEDRIVGRFEFAEILFHLHPSIGRPAITAFGVNGMRFSIGSHMLDWSVAGAMVNLSRSTYHPSFGISLDNSCITCRVQGDRMPSLCKNRLAWA